MFGQWIETVMQLIDDHGTDITTLGNLASHFRRMYEGGVDEQTAAQTVAELVSIQDELLARVLA